MEIGYKGFKMIIAAEYEDKSEMWNGRYRILNDKKVVVYESFVESCTDQEKASESPKHAANAWIDEQNN